MAILPGLPGLEVSLISDNIKMKDMPAHTSLTDQSHHLRRVVEAAGYGAFFVLIEVNPSYVFWTSMLEVQVYMDDALVHMEMIRPCDLAIENAQVMLPYSPEALEDEKAEKRSLNFYEWTAGGEKENVPPYQGHGDPASTSGCIRVEFWRMTFEGHFQDRQGFHDDAFGREVEMRLDESEPFLSPALGHYREAEQEPSCAFTFTYMSREQLLKRGYVRDDQESME